jgi:hypothetical protein
MFRAQLAAALALVTVALFAACGGSGAAPKAREAFDHYLAYQADRGTAEAEFNRAFRTIAAAAEARERTRLLAAARSARAAGARIHRALEHQLAAAAELAAYGATRADGRRLRQALRRSRDGLLLFEQQLAIAERDPFLDRKANADEVRRLSRHALALRRRRGGAAARRARARRGVKGRSAVRSPLRRRDRNDRFVADPNRAPHRSHPTVVTSQTRGGIMYGFDRRRFLGRTAGAALLGGSVPALLAACGGDDDEEVATVEERIDRREAVQQVAVAVAIPEAQHKVFGLPTGATAGRWR